MSSCGCQIEQDCDGGPSLFTEKILKARKQHKCCECKEVIQPGESYERVKGLWEGVWQKYDTCMHCLSLRKVFFCGYTYGEVLWDLEEHIRESGGEVLDSQISKLTPKARNRVFDLVEKLWAEEDED